MDLTATTRARLAAASPADIDDVRAQRQPLVAFSPALRAEATELKQFLHRQMYRHERVHRNSVKAHEVVARLFGHFLETPRLMPAEHHKAARRAERTAGKSGCARVVADYIAGMTDRYALSEHERLL